MYCIVVWGEKRLRVDWALQNDLNPTSFPSYDKLNSIPPLTLMERVLDKHVRMCLKCSQLYGSKSLNSYTILVE